MDELIYRYPIQNAAFIDKIMKVMSSETGFTEEAICAKSRKRVIVETRQLAMHLSRQFTNESLAQIGIKIGGKDHATVLHACKTINNLRDSDRKFAARYNALFISVGGTIIDHRETALVCKDCGGMKIQIREWTDANTRKFIHPKNHQQSIDNNWCADCKSSTIITTRAEYRIYQNELTTQEKTEELKDTSLEEQKQQIIELGKELGV